MDDWVDELLDRLEPHVDFLREVAEQGDVEIWISSHSKGNHTLVLRPQLIARLAALAITLVHDVYAAEQHSSN